MVNSLICRGIFGKRGWTPENRGDAELDALPNCYIGHCDYLLAYSSLFLWLFLISSMPPFNKEYHMTL